MKHLHPLRLLLSVIIPLLSQAADISERRMVWAHHVPWYKPENTSLTPDMVYCYPLHDVVEQGDRIANYRQEIRNAMDMGIDGFLIDVGLNDRNRPHDSRIQDYLKATEGTDFQLAFCLDGTCALDKMADDLAWMFSTASGHPNYAHVGKRPVLATYQFWHRGDLTKPENWRQLLRLLAQKGYSPYIIANVDPRVLKSLDIKRLDDFKDSIDCAYLFGACGINNEHPEVVAPLLNQWCTQNGRSFMPCLQPGYYGAWLKSGNDFYQPFVGLDMLHETFMAAMSQQPQWLHLTTYNDLIETALMRRAWSTGYAKLIRAYSDRHHRNGQLPNEPEVIFAYHREEQPGTVLRLEAMSLPSSTDDSPLTLSGQLRDWRGNIVASLTPRHLSPKGFERCEWVIPTTGLAASPTLRPEFRVTSGTCTQEAVLPEIMLVSSWLQNAVTVNMALSDVFDAQVSLVLTPSSDGLLHATCNFESPSPVKRITLFRDDRPLAVFSPELKPHEGLFSCRLSGIDGEASITLKRGRIVRAVKNYERNGCRWFRWDSTSLKTTATPRWSLIGLTLAGEPEMEMTITSRKGTQTTITGAELISRGQISTPDWTLQLSPELTMQNAQPLQRQRGKLQLKVADYAPQASSSYFAVIQNDRGQFHVTPVQYPYADESRPISLTLTETPITLEDTSGPIGWCRRGRSVFLHPEDVPVTKTSHVTASVSPLTGRQMLYHFNGNGLDSTGLMHLNIPSRMFRENAVHFNGKDTFKLRYRTWPGNLGSISFRLRPQGACVRPQAILTKRGWTDGISIALTPDRRLELTYSFRTPDNTTGEGQQTVTLLSNAKLPSDTWTQVVIQLTGNAMSLLLDGQTDARQSLPPARSYGNLTVVAGGGRDGYDNYTGDLDELHLQGLPSQMPTNP